MFGQKITDDPKELFSLKEQMVEYYTKALDNDLSILNWREDPKLTPQQNYDAISALVDKRVQIETQYEAALEQWATVSHINLVGLIPKVVGYSRSINQSQRDSRQRGVDSPINVEGAFGNKAKVDKTHGDQPRA